MAVYKWTRRPTKHFGQVWVPLARIDLQRTDRRYQAFIVQFDSGATVSLLKRSVADVLGRTLTEGRAVELGGVGGGTTRAYVHEIPTRFDESMVLNVPYAIADNENVPNLLGRLGVFDPLQVDFDGTLRETRVVAPWLSEGDVKLFEFLLGTERHVLGRWQELQLQPRSDEAARRLIQRAAQSFASCVGLLKLHRTYDAIVFVRVMFELAAQLEYLLRDPVPRSELYLEYEHITKHRVSSEIVRDPKGAIGRSLAESTARAEGEQNNQTEFDRVKGRYRRNGDRLWDKWYCKSFRGLCKEIGWDGEYVHWYAIASGWAHGDPFFARMRFPLGDRGGALWFLLCAHYYARMLLRVSPTIVLTNEQFTGLTALAQDMA